MGGTGVRRTLGWVKYLREHGWLPSVLTVQGGDAPFEDPSLSRHVPADILAYRAHSIEPVRFVKRMLRKTPSDAQHRPGYGYRTTSLDWLRGLIPWVLFPDRRIGWLAPAIASGIHALRSQPVDLICSTYSDSITAHFVAYALKVVSNKPWVADFQDPWSEPYVSIFPSSLHRNIARHIEQTIFKRADHIIVTTHAVRETYERKYPSLARGKISVIPIGFDPEVFQTRSSASFHSSFRITHFGVFWGPRSPEPFLKGLAQAIEMNSGLARCVEVKLLGTLDPKYRVMTERMLSTYRLEQSVHLEDPVPYADGVDILLDSDVLLLVLDNTGSGRCLVPCKLFDYLAAAKPILALAPNGETGRIVREAKAGAIVDPSDASQIAHAIVRLYEQWQEDNLRPAIDMKYAQQFAYKETTKFFASVLNQVMYSHQALQRDMS